MGLHYIQDSDDFKTEDGFVESVERILDGQDYDNGAVEAAQDQANAISALLGRLLLMMREKNLLSDEEIQAVLDPSTLGYRGGNWVWPKKGKPVDSFAPEKADKESIWR